MKVGEKTQQRKRNSVRREHTTKVNEFFRFQLTPTKVDTVEYSSYSATNTSSIDNINNIVKRRTLQMIIQQRVVATTSSNRVGVCCLGLTSSRARQCSHCVALGASRMPKAT